MSMMVDMAEAAAHVNAARGHEEEVDSDEDIEDIDHEDEDRRALEIYERKRLLEAARLARASVVGGAERYGFRDTVVEGPLRSSVCNVAAAAASAAAGDVGDASISLQFTTAATGVDRLSQLSAYDVLRLASVGSRATRSSPPSKSDFGTGAPLPRVPLSRYCAFIRPQRGFLVLAFIVAVMSTAAELAQPMFVGGVIETMTEVAASDGTMTMGAAGRSIVWLAVLVPTQFIMTYLQEVIFDQVAINTSQDLRAAYFRAMLRQEVAFFDKVSCGVLVSRLAEDVVAMRSLLARGPTIFALGILRLSGGLYFTFTVSWRLALIGCVPIPLIAVVLWFFGGSIKRRQVAFTDRMAATAASVAEAISNIRTVRAFGTEQREISLYLRRMSEALRLGHRVTVMHGLYDGALGVFRDMFFVAFLWYGSNLIVSGAITIGKLAEFALYVNHVSQGFEELASGFGLCMSTFGQSQRFFELLDRKPKLVQLAPPHSPPGGAEGGAEEASGTSKVGSTEGPRCPGADAAAPQPPAAEKEGETARDGMLRPSSVEGRIEFRGVTFAYPARRNVNVLAKRSLVFNPKQKYALCGPSGCGKSTVLQLIQRLYDVSLGNGAILLDGRDIRTLCPRWLRRQIAVVPQTPVLFSGTVAENIAYGSKHRAGGAAARALPTGSVPARGAGGTGRSGGSWIWRGSSGAAVPPVVGPRELQGAVEAAAKVAHAHNFITKLPRGYDTAVSTALLSGGQLQRIAIARAVIRSAPILLLDEVTSALDARSAGIVNDALREVATGKTVISVTHERQAPMGFNRINMPPPPPNRRQRSQERYASCSEQKEGGSRSPCT